ncbi:ParA family protein [Pseudobutyrivibrio sp.]|uniref:ParA family protein n=1 Tax=Pseudobutyrivibrio sp. TaxID=2014367 RepID=UPI001D7B157E|nr:AAA family ATPase [Pseudobutyrivibrio sp.]MBE5911988.1 ParA family protein [Pseudobutyrivibrio sp.]
MKTIAICIGKGGQWKTSLTCNMAYLLKEKGYNVLVIDCDTQGNASLTFKADMNDATLYDCWVEERRPMDPMDCIQHTELGDIIVADSLLSNLNSMIMDPGSNLVFTSLKEKVFNKLQGYDYVLLDCPPDLTGSINKSVLASVDEALIPLVGDAYSIQGLANQYKLIQSLAHGETAINPDLKVNGFVVTNYTTNRNVKKNHYENAVAIAEKMGTKVYKQYIRACKDGELAIDNREAVVKSKPWCNSSIDYKAFVEEFLESEGK